MRTSSLRPRIPRVCAAALLASFVLGACDREARRYRDMSPSTNTETTVRVTTLQPGAPQQSAPVASPYQGNAWGIGEGKRLYSAFNCAPCHGVNGGGAIGPALIDDKWIYGAGAEQIYATISQGRPNGMPSFGGHVPVAQIWQLVAYVQAMSGQVEASIATSRNDDQMAALPESRQSRQTPVQTGHR
jgi:cytochrome c oxidase cbb3-type subunit 3